MTKVQKKAFKCLDNGNHVAKKNDIIEIACKTAPLYNGGQNYMGANKPNKTKKKHVKYAISLDWFEVTLEIFASSHSSLLCFASEPPESLEIGNFQMELQVAGTRFYKHKFKVYHHGEPFGMVSMNPRSTQVLEGNWCQFKMDNHKLYQSSWISEFDEFMDELEAKPRSFSRIDIALDGRGHLDIYKQWNSGNIDRLGRAKVIEYKEKVGGKDNVVTGVNWGSRGGDKHMTIYSKGNLLERENKGYIVDFWEKNGLINDSSEVENIERMELKLKSKSINKLIDFDYKRLNEPEYMASIMRTHFKKWFEFTETGTGNVSRKKRLEFINWNSIGGELMDTDSTRPSNEVWSAKISIKRLYILAIEGLLSPTIDEHISDIIGWYDLESWYERSRDKWKPKVKSYSI